MLTSHQSSVFAGFLAIVPGRVGRSQSDHYNGARRDSPRRCRDYRTSFAHMACIVVAVSAGAILAQYLSPRHLTLGGAALFLLFGLSAGYEAIYEVAPPAPATF